MDIFLNCNIGMLSYLVDQVVSNVKFLKLKMHVNRVECVLISELWYITIFHIGSGISLILQSIKTLYVALHTKIILPTNTNRKDIIIKIKLLKALYSLRVHKNKN